MATQCFAGNVSFPDMASFPYAAINLGAATNQFAITPGVGGNKIQFTAANPGQATTITIPDPGVASANLVFGNYVAPNVTQITNIDTAVTNNASRGRITLAAVIPATTSSSFVVTCAPCVATSTIFLSTNVTPGAAGPLIFNTLAAAGQFTLYIYNLSAAATGTVPVISYIVM